MPTSGGKTTGRGLTRRPSLGPRLHQPRPERGVGRLANLSTETDQDQARFLERSLPLLRRPPTVLFSASGRRRDAESGSTLGARELTAAYKGRPRALV